MVEEKQLLYFLRAILLHDKVISTYVQDGHLLSSTYICPCFDLFSVPLSPIPWVLRTLSFSSMAYVALLPRNHFFRGLKEWVSYSSYQEL